MTAIFLTTFPNAFSWMEMYKFRLRFHWSLFPWAHNIPVLVPIMAWYRPGDKPVSELNDVMVSLLMHICVTRPQWVKATIYGLWWDIGDIINLLISLLLRDFLTIYFPQRRHMTTSGLIICVPVRQALMPVNIDRNMGQKTTIIGLLGPNQCATLVYL